MKEFKSFSFAIKGISVAIRDESHYRFHLTATFYVFFFGILYHLTKLQWCILVLNISAVLTAEMFNTAIENICDIYTKDYNKNIKIIKDISAGGVLVSAITSFICGVFIFLDLQEITSIAEFYIHTPLALLELIFTIIISTVFVAKPSCINHKFDL
ncbi:MAG: diacylglycerol kinase family protein [Oscillospiraceae bacterium]|nr:diacylglycerol kinase family protein [Oscillospiraceae bacterium]